VDDGIHGRELWVSDGTTEGTAIVKDINPGEDDSDPGALVSVNGRLYFAADDGTHGRELWVLGYIFEEHTGDFNEDGAVTYDDFTDYLLPAYGTQTGDPDFVSEYDLNQDGSIDMLDYAEWYKDFLDANQ
jgi:ELWxxDGT repeat protein